MSASQNVIRPFIKWAGGKRWLTSHPAFCLPEFAGRYIEPFLGGGAVFFYLQPENALLSDVNKRLIETYIAIRDDHLLVERELRQLQRRHSKDFYYEERRRSRRRQHTRAAQFLYLNRTCWNGLYRENTLGQFNVPLGTKTKIVSDDENFRDISQVLASAEIVSSDFEEIIDRAKRGDLVFVDPPYTTAHNNNGFIKYNQNIFSWDDQIRLRDCVERAFVRGVKILLTNADHPNIHDLYSRIGDYNPINRSSVIAGSASHRGRTTEALYVLAD